MKTRLLLALAATAVFLGLLSWQQARTSRLTTEVRELKQALAGAEVAQTELAALRARVPDPDELERMRQSEAALRLEVARLGEELATARRASPGGASSTPAPAAGAKPKPSLVNSAISFAMKSAVEQQTVGKLQRLKPRLNLTPEQEEAIRALLSRQAEQATAVAEKMLSGKLTREELGAMKTPAMDAESEIKALLTPEQQAAYADFKQEENVGNARLVANAELLQMQGALGLNPDQQDKVYNALYDSTLDTLNGKLGDVPPPTDPAEALNWQLERKLQVLEPVLTPEQLEAYRRLQENQRKLIENFLPAKATPPAP